MLIDFFYTLRAAKLPVSVTEYLTLLEALEAGVVGPSVPAGDADDEATGYSIDDFYHLARTVMVKDEKHFDKFDRAFWSGQPLDDLYDRIGDDPKGASERIFAAGMNEWRRSHRDDGGLGGGARAAPRPARQD